MSWNNAAASVENLVMVAARVHLVVSYELPLAVPVRFQ